MTTMMMKNLENSWKKIMSDKRFWMWAFTVQKTATICLEHQLFLTDKIDSMFGGIEVVWECLAFFGERSWNSKGRIYTNECFDGKRWGVFSCTFLSWSQMSLGKIMPTSFHKQSSLLWILNVWYLDIFSHAPLSLL